MSVESRQFAHFVLHKEGFSSNGMLIQFYICIRKYIASNLRLTPAVPTDKTYNYTILTSHLLCLLRLTFLILLLFKSVKKPLKMVAFVFHYPKQIKVYIQIINKGFVCMSLQKNEN